MVSNSIAFNNVLMKKTGTFIRTKKNLFVKIGTKNINLIINYNLPNYNTNIDTWTCNTTKSEKQTLAENLEKVNNQVKLEMKELFNAFGVKDHNKRRSATTSKPTITTKFNNITDLNEKINNLSPWDDNKRTTSLTAKAKLIYNCLKLGSGCEELVRTRNLMAVSTLVQNDTIEHSTTRCCPDECSVRMLMMVKNTNFNCLQSQYMVTESGKENLQKLHSVLDDSVVELFLEKFGRYFTDVGNVREMNFILGGEKSFTELSNLHREKYLLLINQAAQTDNDSKFRKRLQDIPKIYESQVAKSRSTRSLKSFVDYWLNLGPLTPNYIDKNDDEIRRLLATENEKLKHELEYDESRLKHSLDITKKGFIQTSDALCKTNAQSKYDFQYLALKLATEKIFEESKISIQDCLTNTAPISLSAHAIKHACLAVNDREFCSIDAIRSMLGCRITGYNIDGALRFSLHVILSLPVMEKESEAGIKIDNIPIQVHNFNINRFLGETTKKPISSTKPTSTVSSKSILEALLDELNSKSRNKRSIGEKFYFQQIQNLPTFAIVETYKANTRIAGFKNCEEYGSSTLCSHEHRESHNAENCLEAIINKKGTDIQNFCAMSYSIENTNCLVYELDEGFLISSNTSIEIHRNMKKSRINIFQGPAEILEPGINFLSFDQTEYSFSFMCGDRKFQSKLSSEIIEIDEDNSTIIDWEIMKPQYPVGSNIINKIQKLENKLEYTDNFEYLPKKLNNVLVQKHFNKVTILLVIILVIVIVMIILVIIWKFGVNSLKCWTFYKQGKSVAKAPTEKSAPTTVRNVAVQNRKIVY